MPLKGSRIRRQGQILLERQTIFFSTLSVISYSRPSESGASPQHLKKIAVPFTKNYAIVTVLNVPKMK